MAWRTWLGAGAVVAGLVAIAVGWGARLIRMPGASYQGPPSPVDEGLRAQLEADVRELAETIGPRHLRRPEALEEAAAYVEERLEEAGYEVRSQRFEVDDREGRNLIATLPGTDPDAPAWVIGAHYDTVPETPGADDNASGVAALLALAERLAHAEPEHTVHWVAFVNEEPPWFQSPAMGSYRYARRLSEEGEQVAGMLSLESLAWYSDREGSQQYPWPFSWFYPSRGDFVGFVGNVASRGMVRRAVGTFRTHATIPSEGAAIPAAIPGVGFSDHWSFWQFGWPAVMVTDTAMFRNPHYHQPTDTVDRIDLEALTRVVEGLEPTVRALVGAE